MHRRILQLAVVLVTGVVALTIDSPQPLQAAEAECGSGVVICTTSCPPYPHLMCQSYGCSGQGASCVHENCSGLEYSINCAAN